MQELTTHLLFYTGIGAFPIGIATLIFGIRHTQKITAFLLILSGGACISHFIWYGGYLAWGIAGTATSPLPPAWWSRLPFGIGAATLAFLIRHYLALRARTKHPTHLNKIP